MEDRPVAMPPFHFSVCLIFVDTCVVRLPLACWPVPRSLVESFSFFLSVASEMATIPNSATGDPVASEVVATEHSRRPGAGVKLHASHLLPPQLWVLRFCAFKALSRTTYSGGAPKSWMSRSPTPLLTADSPMSSANHLLTPLTTGDLPMSCVSCALTPQS